MKKFALILATAAAGYAVPATAETLEGAGTSGVQTAVFTVNGATPAKCQINADTTTVALSGDITNDGGFVKSDLGETIANQLNTLGVKAWCTGANNSVSLGRTSLTLDGSSGGVDAGGFNRNVIYDLLMKIDGAVRVDGGDQEGSEDGLDSGANPKFKHFGPSGAGAALTFSDGYTQASATGSADTSSGARSLFPNSSARIVAGSYTGTVTLQITPGL
jgi:hypothetical protein